MLKNCIWLLKYIGYSSSSELEPVWKKLYDFGDISLTSVVPFVYTGMGKEVKESTELRSWNYCIFYFCLCFANAVFFVPLCQNIYSHCYLKLWKRQEKLTYSYHLAFTK